MIMSKFLLAYSATNQFLFGCQVINITSNLVQCPGVAALSLTRSSAGDDDNDLLRTLNFYKNSETIVAQVELLQLEAAKEEFYRILDYLESKGKFSKKYGSNFRFNFDKADVNEEARLEADKWFKLAVLGRKIEISDFNFKFPMIREENYNIQDMLNAACRLNEAEYWDNADLWSLLRHSAPKKPADGPKFFLIGSFEIKSREECEREVFRCDDKKVKKCSEYLTNNNSNSNSDSEMKAWCWYEIGRIFGSRVPGFGIRLEKTTVGGKEYDGIDCLNQARHLDGNYENKSRWWLAMASLHKWPGRNISFEDLGGKKMYKGGLVRKAVEVANANLVGN